MGYLGVPPQSGFITTAKQRVTGSTNNYVDLDHAISNLSDVIVWVNFVKQDSTTYSVGGTGNKTLTLGGTLVSSDIVEVHYLNIVGQTVAPSSGSVTTATINDTPPPTTTSISISLETACKVSFGILFLAPLPHSR